LEQVQAVANIAGGMPNDSNLRQTIIKSQALDKYNRMLHPPLTYLGDAFQYRSADGKFHSAMNPHLGQAGAPYAKTVPSKTHPLGALPDPEALFERLMAREPKGRDSKSGLSSMLIYHATVIIHDIFRTNDKDKNISDCSSYLDLSPLYGYTEEMQHKVRDGKYKLGLLKPDTFAEDRLLRQPPGVCIMLVMYNRYHNYCATQLRRINENGRFSVPAQYVDSKLVSVAKHSEDKQNLPFDFEDTCKAYETEWRLFLASDKTTPKYEELTEKLTEIINKGLESRNVKYQKDNKAFQKAYKQYLATVEAAKAFDPPQHVHLVEPKAPEKPKTREQFEADYDAAWNKLDDDLFNTARL
jgi:hypothetical protein